MRRRAAPRTVARSKLLAGLGAAVLTCALGLAGPQYDPDAPEPIARIRGSLVLGGGGELSEDVYARFVELAGADDARVVVFDTTGEQAHARWAMLGVSDASVHTTIADRAARDELARASGAWFAGGDPRALTEALREPELRAALDALLERGGALGGGDAFSRVAAAARLVAIDAGGESGAAWLAGSVVVTGYDEARDRERLVEALELRPDLVGFGIGAGSALVLENRWLSRVGEQGVFALIAASERRPLRVDPILPATRRRRRPADLIALSRSAVARSRASFPPAEPAAPILEHGALIIAGGGGLPDSIVRRFIELAGGPEAPIVCIPCTEREELRREPSAVGLLRAHGARAVTWIHTKDRERADTDETLLGPLRAARGLWFGGGRQWNFVDSYQDTTVHRLMHEVLGRGGVIGGSSAGASIQADYMVRGNPLGNQAIMSEGYERGLGFLTGVAVDQHFSQRGRLEDMTQLVDTYPQLLGIGLDESTAIVVQGSVAEVLGRSDRRVFFYDRRREVVDAEHDHLRLAPGERFDLVARRRVE